MRLPGLLLLGIFATSAHLPRASGKIHIDICALPPVNGPCLALFTRWFYSPRARRCQTFTYGGCLGNANNFNTRSQCEQRCLRPVIVKSGTCPVPVHNGDVVMCGEFCSTDMSCPGSERCCDTSCGRQCLLPTEASPGYCPRPTRRPVQTRLCVTRCLTDWDCGWGVQIPRRKCCRYGCQQTCTAAEEEHPGVCPKRIVVQTFAPCNNTCRDDRDCPLTQKCCFTGCARGCLDPVRSHRCQLPMDRGPCRASIPRFFYSPSQKRCILFLYGGCRGNSNNFETREECRKACGRIDPEICKQPKESGVCQAYSEFFYYNATLASCEIFASCRCHGNDNQFFTELECMMVCGKTGRSSNATRS
uniref:Uncharacterized protein n=1 Tax=Salvator merianae TaxID=96440 RepID=A0A8D0C2U0_SALMN